MKLKIYTDGACSGNPGKGGWAAIILDDSNQLSLSGSESNTTNNRMELLAPIMALKKIKREFRFHKIYLQRLLVNTGNKYQYFLGLMLVVP